MEQVAGVLERGVQESQQILELSGVTKSFDQGGSRLDALIDIHFTVREGEFLCIVGPSGCGKSTLLHLLAGLEQPTSGEIRLRGRAVTGPGPDRVVIFQEAALFPWLNVLENVEFGLKVRGLSRAERREKALDVLEMVGLAKFRSAYVHQLSGGMKQRVAIARGLVMDPEILLMDEPFSALDAQTRDVLHDELQQIWIKTQKTIVFVTHNVREAACLGDRVVLLSANPGQLKKEYFIQMPHPRRVEDPGVIEIVRTIQADLKQAHLRLQPGKKAL